MSYRLTMGRHGLTIDVCGPSIDGMVDRLLPVRHPCIAGLSIRAPCVTDVMDLLPCCK